MINFLNTRETAFLIWALIAGVFGLIIPKVRKSIFAFFKMAFSNQIVIPYAIMLAYIFLIAYMIYLLGFWNIVMLKATILWTLFAASSTFFKLEELAKDKKRYFRELLIDCIKLTTLIEFFIGFYTFPLWIELTMLPLGTLFIFMLLVTHTDEKHTMSRKLLTRSLNFLAISTIFYASYKLISNVSSFANKETFYDFAVAPVFSVLFIPFAFFLSIYSEYERGFAGLANVFKSKNLMKYAKYQAMKGFLFNTIGLNRWKTRLFQQEINRKEDINSSIKDIKTLQKVEKNPLNVPLNLGWSPHAAKNLLAKEGLVTGFYNKLFEDDWSACSPLLELGKNDLTLSNNIAYYVSGNHQVANLLYLNLNVNTPIRAAHAHEILLKYARLLYQAVVNEDMPIDLYRNISLGEAVNIITSKNQVSIEKKIWDNRKGYHIKFMIHHLANSQD